MKKLKLGVIGCGYLGNIIVDACLNGLLEEYELVGVMGKSPSKVQETAKRAGCATCFTAEELLALKPDYIAEAASIQAVKDLAMQILKSGAGLVVLSAGAFADAEFYQKVSRTAAEAGVKVHIASGAVGGFDVFRTVSLMGQASAKIETRKGPGSLQGTPVFEERLMTDESETRVYQGNAKGAIALFPTKVNVAVAVSLASIGPEYTGVSIDSVPQMTGDDHKITAECDGVRAIVDIYSKTSAIAGWSVVAVLRNIVSPIVF